MNTELVEFAERVRIVCGKSLARMGMGHSDDAVQMISDLCGQAEAIVHGAKMQQESTSESRYDLTELKVDFRNSDSETGEE